MNTETLERLELACTVADNIATAMGPQAIPVLPRDLRPLLESARRLAEIEAVFAAHLKREAGCNSDGKPCSVCTDTIAREVRQQFTARKS